MSWAAVITTAAQAGYGIYQTQRAKRLKDEAGERPDYQIPDSAVDALGTAQLRSMQGMDSEVKSQMLQEMDRARMASLSQINERRGGLGTVVATEQAQQDSLRQMAAMDIQQREKNLLALQEQRGIMAGYEEQKRADELGYWEQQSQAASAMMGAGIQNIAGAATSLATAGISAGGSDSNMFTGKKREAFNMAGGKQGTGMSFKDFRKAEAGGGGYADFIQENPSFLSTRLPNAGQYNMSGVGSSTPKRATTFQDNTSTSLETNKINTNILTQKSSDLLSVDKNSLIYKDLGFNTTQNYNQGITDNLTLSSNLDKFDATFGVSTQRQLFGSRFNTSGGSGTIINDEWKKNYPLLYPEYQS